MDEVRTRTGQQSLDNILRKRRLRWLGHLLRIDHQRIVIDTDARFPGTRESTIDRDQLEKHSKERFAKDERRISSSSSSRKTRQRRSAAHPRSESKSRQLSQLQNCKLPVIYRNITLQKHYIYRSNFCKHRTTPTLYDSPRQRSVCCVHIFYASLINMHNDYTRCMYLHHDD